jgi:hypothetical protein
MDFNYYDVTRMKSRFAIDILQFQPSAISKIQQVKPFGVECIQQQLRAIITCSPKTSIPKRGK